mmetsp:Transcript_15391/g.33355  ORF Transcript_15391/g.33355 Transcript_15391/m.33355 type:complete len:187 (-) Transcript_15391:1055-1615(-)|eukprot:CAMPEP_0202900862 /NCGR_PEP_ID=MMETSP1392-20130828/12080_1 /ASSEMBLY_ACC=CAM_ASM_000868 /TAXON_ID=225041 /ORGANISM="Chlamydomonas chlamydogama, Strain SAG 11-48b" /LENGTH=186 /DNA_ID=CAMNT_0049587315 /DNA_START=50 /DNA_END=610 /DNA_ORIENTATION=-
MPPAEQKKTFGRGAKYSKSEVIALFKTFQMLDADDKGKIDGAGLVRKLQESGKKFGVSHVEFIRAMDINHDGYLDFKEILHKMFPLATPKEFTIMYRWAYPATPKEQGDPTFSPTEEQLTELRDMFKLYDKNGNGSLDKKELAAAAASAGYDPEEVDALFESTDTNHDSVISFDEFVELMQYSYIQ